MSNKIMRLEPIAIRLSDSNTSAPHLIQVIRTGTFHHPSYGKFDITPAHLLSFKKNFDAKVRGVDLALDYGHASEGEAAGWFKDLELSADGTQLWAVTDWTPDGSAAVLGKKYRYVSADFNFDYEDNETLKKYGPTLLGAGLTNRPVVKNQAPVIELTEGKGAQMTPEQEKQLADLVAAVSALKASVEELKKEKDPADGEDVEASAKPPVLSPAEEEEKKKKDAQLSEAKATIKKLEDEKAAGVKKLAFDKQLSEGKVCEAQREAFMANDMDKFLSLAKPLKLSEAGSGKNPDGKKFDKPADEVLALATEAVEAKRATSMTQAMSLVLSENADLAKRFQEQR